LTAGPLLFHLITLSLHLLAHRFDGGGFESFAFVFGGGFFGFGQVLGAGFIELLNLRADVAAFL